MPKVVVIVQARLSSSRLPAKTMLTICNKSVIAIIAERLRSTKYELVFALPEGDEGNLLSREIKLANPTAITSFGSLNNVLSRFYNAAKNYQDEDIIIRLTADNIFIDDIFIDELIEKYQGGYSSAEINDIAYGISAEIFQKKHLAEAYNNAESSFQKEHVTPYIRDKYLTNLIKHNYKPAHKVRLTLDNYQDFLNVNKVFSAIDNPINESWEKLVSKSCEIFPSQKKLMIGTVQFGINYGIANKTGQVTKEQVSNIIREANNASVFAYDTAAEYGESQSILGENANILGNSEIITKLQHSVENERDVERSILVSLKQLKRNNLDGVLLHKASQLNTPIWQALIEQKKSGLVNKIGVSVYSPEEAQDVINDKNADILQIPYNILDWRWNDFIKENQEYLKNNIEIHVRSVFLQGAILHSDILDKKDGNEINQKLDGFVQKFNRKNRADLAISFVKSQQWVRYLVIGMDNLQQAKNNFDYFNEPPLTQQQINEINSSFSNLDIDIDILDIRKWK